MSVLPSTSLVIPGLSPADQDVLTGLLNRLSRSTARNVLRRSYYDHKNVLKDFNISIPPSMKSVETIVGWPAKAVDVLARRVRLQSFYLPGGDLSGVGFEELIEQNRLLAEADQAATSALVMSPAFVSVTAGDVAAGEPAAIVTCRSALYATGEWDRRLRGLRSAMSIVSVDVRTGQPDHLVLYVPNRAIICRREGQRWDLRQSVHDLGVPVEPLVFRPELDRPFGRSRITRGVMSITDRAVRTVLRSEVSAEFFSAPQRYALGASEDAFTDANGNTTPGWVTIIGRLLTIGRDEDGNVPTVGQFAQQSMEPHLAQLRQEAAEFAAETDLMPDTLGVIQDNPSSAEAIDQRKEELRLTAESCIGAFSPAWNRTARSVLKMLDGSPSAVAECAKVRSRWRNPATPSQASAADATIKLISAGVLTPDSEVTYDGLSMSEDQREVLRIEQARARGRTGIAALAAVPGSAPGTSPEIDESKELKAKFDALGVAIRAGVEPVDAAVRLGLAGIAFTGATPVALRLPANDATAMEAR